ncbi:unnamed protein product [Haemonchus placei]|uniref:Homeobox domain-containing protein n=1 Tax=Haemonchus placei TaxID=6290 RepID=A0A0N4X6E1_HAEPC|nr:unnamed protein product [Haemonchus placei]
MLGSCLADALVQAHFQVDSNPDGADLERIASMTGLSKRVTQVWFQNSRARQKKFQSNRKACEATLENIHSINGPVSPSQKSEASSDGIFPSSVLTRSFQLYLCIHRSLTPNVSAQKKPLLILQPWDLYNVTSKVFVFSCYPRCSSTR